MSTTYLAEVVSNKKFTGNVIIKIDGQYYGIRQPDSGLSISEPFARCVLSLILNPTQIDIRRVTTTVASYSFRLVDRQNVITNLIAGDAAAFIGREVEIWLGRSGVDMDFADYYKLPITRVKKVDHSDNSYNFSSTEETDRMGKEIYSFKSALAVDILTGTTTFTMRDSIADFPSTGFLKLDNEFVSYAGKDLVLNQFTGVIRGELNSTVANHSSNTDCVLVETLTDNPLNIILKILISGGGGGTYDVLQDGLGIDESLVDLTEIETLRDNLFSTRQFTLSLYNIESALKFMEEQLLMPNNLRFTYSKNSKLTLAVLDKAVFVEDTELINEGSINAYPKWSVDGNRVVNALEIQWGFNEGTNMYEHRDVVEDALSIAAYGRQTPLKYNFKGVQELLDGEDIISDFAERLLARLSTPTPEVQVNTHVDKSLQNIGDKTRVESSQIPAATGSLNFASELEIVSRSINYQTGDVQFKLAFTSFTQIRSCYIAPSDKFLTAPTAKQATVAAGRGDSWIAGWAVRLWDIAAEDYTGDPVNYIESISGDTINFLNAWVTSLSPATNFRLKFADYDDCVDTQKRYCFMSDGGANFDDGKPTYRITY